MRRMIIVGVLAFTTVGGALGAVSAFAGFGHASTAHHSLSMAKPNGSQWA